MVKTNNHNSDQEIIGLDVGQAKIGVARASTVARLAEPLMTLESEEAVEKLQELISETPLKAIIVGLPRNLQGDETEQTKWTRQWLESAKQQIKLPFYWQDEALTSQGADHPEAAARILQDFLDSPEAKKVGC